MSVTQIAKVWDHDFSGTRQCIMLALADWADDDGGNIFPAMQRVAHKVGVGKRCVQQHMSALRKSGVLVIVSESTWNKPTGYRINWSEAPAKKPYQQPEFHSTKRPTEQNERGEECSPPASHGVNGDSSGGELSFVGDAGGGERPVRKGVNADSPKPSVEPLSNTSSLRSEGQAREKSKSESSKSNSRPSGQLQKVEISDPPDAEPKNNLADSWRADLAAIRGQRNDENLLCTRLFGEVFCCKPFQRRMHGRIAKLRGKLDAFADEPDENGAQLLCRSFLHLAHEGSFHPDLNEERSDLPTDVLDYLTKTINKRDHEQRTATAGERTSRREQTIRKERAAVENYLRAAG